MNLKKPILVVEDEAAIRQNMLMLLQDEGYSCYAASNGEEALKILVDPTKTLPCLIALDFYMPVMDACAFLDALSILQKTQQDLDMAIVLLTAADPYAYTNILHKTVGVIRKPINIEKFLKIVEKYCVCEN